MKNRFTYESLASQPDLWQSLQNESRPIFLYGTGNGADKILDALLERGVTPEGVFASDGFVRNRVFRGYEVVSYSSVREKFGDDIVVLLCFGTDRDEVVSFIEELDRRHTLLVPDVPLYGGEIFTADYLIRNEEKLLKARSLLYDEVSRVFFDAVVAFRLTGKYKYLKIVEDPKDSLESLLENAQVSVAVDLGAFKGDTAKLFFETFKESTAIYAVEPDPKTFLKLSDFAGKCGDGTVVKPLNFAASDHLGEVSYSGSASRGAGVMGKNHRAKETIVSLNTVDNLKLPKVDFIKYDVEGDEAAALRGSAETIARCAPSLAISLYHRTDDLFELPLMALDLLKDKERYTFHLRRPWCIPAWDITFYAVRM